MVLVLNGVLQDECPMDTTALFMLHPVYRDYANQLLEIPTKTVSFMCVQFFFYYLTVVRTVGAVLNRLREIKIFTVAHY